MTTRRPAVNPKKLRPYDQPPRRRRSLIPSNPDSASMAFIIAAALWLALAGGIGVLAIALGVVPFQLSYALGVFNLAVTVDGPRVEYAFVNATVFGWLSNAAFAAICFMAPRLAGRRLALEPLLVLASLIWNGALFAGVVSLFFFDIRPHAPLTAMFWLFDGGLAFAAFIVTLSFLLTSVASLRGSYVSTWFVGVALLALMGFLGIDALVGLLDVFLEIPELAVALGSAFIERALPNMWLLGVTLGVLHYVVPRAVGMPLASWGLGVLAFLTWLALAPLTGVGELLDSSVPYAITTIGAVATMLMLVPVTLTTANLLMTMQGRWSLLVGAGSASLAVISLAFLLGSTLLAAIGALRTVHTYVGSTDWEMGLLMWLGYGAFTFAAFALFEHAVPRILRRAWRSNGVSRSQLWLVFIGSTLAGVALIGGGLAEASFLFGGAPPEEMSAGMLPYRATAFIGFGMVALGALAQLVNLFLLYTTAERETYVLPGQPAAAGAGH